MIEQQVLNMCYLGLDRMQKYDQRACHWFDARKSAHTTHVFDLFLLL